MSEITPEQLKVASIKGRAEALEAILTIDPESGLEDCIDSYPIGDTGDYGSQWNREKLKKLLDCQDEYSESPLNKITESIECMYWTLVAKRDDFSTFKKLVRGLVQEIDCGKVSHETHSNLNIIRSWIK